MWQAELLVREHGQVWLHAVVHPSLLGLTSRIASLSAGGELVRVRIKKVGKKLRTG